MTIKPDHAFILAAGEGTRLRPYTDDRPKPLVSVVGRPLIDHITDHLVQAGVKHIGVNLHYKGAMIESHLRQRTDVTFRFYPEEELLNTGGGVRQALPDLGDQPFFVVNGDAFWVNDPGQASLQALCEAWDDRNMDLLLLLQNKNEMTLTQGVGDYRLDEQGFPVRTSDRSGTYMFTSIRLCHPRLFNGFDKPAFSFLDLMDAAQEKRRLAGLVHDGAWHHISTPQDLERVNATLDRNKTARKTEQAA